MKFIALSDSQRRVYTDTAQLYQAYQEASANAERYRGSMRWKEINGGEYLVKAAGRKGYDKSLGPRSSETEKIFSEFENGKREAKAAVDTLKDRLVDQARFAKAALVQRVPSIVCNILRLLDQYNLLGKNFIVAGTNCLYAYEAAAGVRFQAELLATQDIDVLWDVRSKLKFISDIGSEGLLGILKKADRSFEKVRSRNFQAVNRDGYLVDLIKAEPNPPWKDEIRQIGDENDLMAVEIRNLDWLLASPRFSAVVIGEDGFPARMVSPDPRAFALHKLWLSEQMDREPVKKSRDKNQAAAVAELVVNYLPQLSFKSEELRMFPEALRKRVNDLPPGL